MHSPCRDPSWLPREATRPTGRLPRASPPATYRAVARAADLRQMRVERRACGDPHVRERTGTSRPAGPGVPSRPAAPDGPFPAPSQPAPADTVWLHDALRDRRPHAGAPGGRARSRGAGHTLVAPQLLRSQALALLFDAVRGGRRHGGAGPGTSRRADPREGAAPRRPRLAAGRLADRPRARPRLDHRRGVPGRHAAQADVFVSVDPAARARADGVVPVGTVEQLSA